MIKYDVKHFQEVLINIKKSQYLENNIKNLEIENEKLKKEIENLLEKFICFGQDLVNDGFLELGKEPYQCNFCKSVCYGDEVTGSIGLNKQPIYICNSCNKA